MAKASKKAKPKQVTRCTYEDVKEPRTPETGHTSTEPTIHDGDYVVFRKKPKGSRVGIVLAQCRGPADPDTGGSYKIKRYSSEKVHLDGDDWRHTRIVLSPTNRDYQPIVVDLNDDESVSIFRECIAVLRGME